MFASKQGKMGVLRGFSNKSLSHSKLGAWILGLIAIALSGSVATGQAVPGPGESKPKVVRITGVRFAYPIIQNWIDKFTVEYPDIQVIIESRGTSDPSQYDILVEAYEPSEAGRQEREYVYVGRYTVLPIANSKSSFAAVYGEKGLNKEVITQLFFHDIFADKDKQAVIKAPFTVYTRLQKAGAPTVFSNYFGYEQKDIRGRAIAGSDEHLIKALLRDSTGLSYAPLPLIYDIKTGLPVDGIIVIPVDLNGNGKVSDDEKIYGALGAVVDRFGSAQSGGLNNVPVSHIHFSVDKNNTSAEAITFLKWIADNSAYDLKAFGYLNPEPGKFDKARFELFATKHVKQ
jgi:phosphate transport system substrate-binding protein